ncbi:GNAT family N-acetyltransferase [Corynebacterium stationis]|uniref:GNAT family N-acetyltransferase n=2 Tax=Corynebacterium stationis TaxID=1705 RepID=UPI002628AC34|nr:GNAT family N-acetyltransferase [Corynebacterium stationis]
MPLVTLWIIDRRYLFEHNAPGIDDYLRLRADTGLTPKTAEQAAPIFENSWLWVRAIEKESGQAVGMGRVIGDSGWCFLIADMATDPAHQRRGIGRAILEELLSTILTSAPDNTYIVLLADAPGRPLYQSMGFVETSPHSIGMQYVPDKTSTQ